MLYGHGDDIHTFGKITANFSSNIFGATDLSRLYRHLSTRMDCMTAYPEPEPVSLEAKLAAAHGIRPDEVCVTNGATEAIYLIAQAFRGMKSYVMQPTFSEYADACRLHRHSVKSVYTLDAIDRNADIVWLCNPNNPTGEVRPAKALTELIESYPSVCFVIDRSYEDYTDKKLLPVAEATEMPQVILLHSAAKRYAIPGLRLGYITAPAALLQRIRMQRMPWSVNAMAIEAAHFFLQNDPPATAPVLTERLLEETQRLRKAIENLKIAEVWPTDTHFFLMRLRIGKSHLLKTYLVEKHRILIRDASNFEGLDNTFVRIATQSSEKNNLLIKALEEWKYSYTC
jgi:threonine-phosphate decarboxylase